MSENERTDSPTKWLTEDEFVELHGEMLKELHGLSEEEIRIDFRAAKEWNEEIQRMRETPQED